MSVTDLFPTDTSTSMLPNKIDWKHDCPESIFAWWLPIAITMGIYAGNIICLAIRWSLRAWLDRNSPNEDKLFDGYNDLRYDKIFGGLNSKKKHNFDINFDFDETESIDCRKNSNRYQIANEDNRMEYFKVNDWPGHSPLDEESNRKIKISLEMEHGRNSETNVGDFQSSIEESNGIGEASGGLDINSMNQIINGHLTRRYRKIKLLMRIYCEKWTSVSYPNGRIMQTTYVLLCTISWIIYILGTIQLYYIETEPGYIESRIGRPPLLVEGICLNTGLKILNWTDFVIHIFFLVYFFIRFGASTDRNLFFFKLTSVIDVLAIAGSIISIFQNRYHIDFGFLRALNIFNFGDVLSYIGILSSNHVIQTVDIFFTMFAMWMVASGLIHLIIHIGDFWKEDHGAKSWNYLDCCYFLLVTMSTVGFGDYSPATIIGKLFICIFIPVAMGIFAMFVPELIRNFTAERYKTESYTALAGHQHVVVCGNFNNLSLHMVLRGFFHIEHASRRLLINMVVLRVSPIDLAMKAIMTKYNAWVKYYQGTPNDPQDLARISFRSALGALVLATPNSSKTNDEDRANIMQAIALKAHSSRVRVLVQLHHFSNKCLLNNFPRWTNRHKDIVICMDELKLGLLAYNCLAPGFATLILNLLNGHRMKNPNNRSKVERWRQDYEYGVSMEIYDVNLSYEFNHLSAQELALFAYEKWNILLVALYCTNPDRPKIIINPAGYRNLKIEVSTMKAVVIATNSVVVSYIQNFCTTCKAHETGQTCQCPRRLESIIQTVGQRTTKKSHVTDELPEYQSPDSEDENGALSSQSEENNSVTDTLATNETINLPVLKRQRLSCHSYTSGAILSSRFTITPFCQTINSGFIQNIAFIPPSSGSGVMPNITSIPHLNPESLSRYSSRQRSRNSVTDYFPVPHRPYLPKHIDSTGCFHWVPDTPINRVKLTASEAARFQFKDHYLLCLVGPIANGALNLKSFIYPLRFHWMEVRDVVILCDTNGVTETEWIKIKNLPHIFLVQGSPCSLNDLSAVHLMDCTSCTILGDSLDDESEDHCLRDKNTLLCAMTIRSLIKQSQKPIHMTTEIHHEQNAHHFSSAASHQQDFKIPLRFQESFARGIVFSNTLLYSSISSLYFSGAVFQFLRVLFFGNSVEELESVNCLRNGLQRGNKQTTPLMSGVRVCVCQMSEAPFRSLFNRSSKRPLRYRDVFTRVLMCWRILCLGIYRLDRRGFRVVYTNPQHCLKIRTDDQIICFIPSVFPDPGAKNSHKDVEDWTSLAPSSPTVSFSTCPQSTFSYAKPSFETLPI